MQKKIIGLLLFLLVFAFGFLLGTNEVLRRKDNGGIKIEENTQIEEIQEVNIQEVSEIIQVKVVSKRESNEIDQVYTVEVTTGLVSDAFSMEVSEIEYMILEPGMTLDIIARDLDNGGLSYTWWRSPKGKLNLHLERPIAIIDPGHGGIDRGYGSNDLWEEKDMNLTMSKLMKDMLEVADITVIMTRTQDTYISLYDRLAMAEYVEADIIISNHINSLDQETSGIEVLYSSHSNPDFANTLARAISTEDLPVFRVYRRKHTTIPGLDYYFLHNYTRIPSYIIEYGFADNEADAEYIHQNWQTLTKKASQAIIDELKK